MIGEVLDSSDNTLDYTDTFEWDVVGNRLETSRDWGDVANDDYTTTYQYDANDRLMVETKVEGSSTTASTYAYDHTQQMGKSMVTGSREAVAACSPERQFGVRFPREAKSRRDGRMGTILAAEKKRNTKIAKSTKVNVRYFREG